ncbi:MAG TPA: VOC family protein [Stellaceae bacterium]|nr:VOC family protein [Stellaceae bacterium]
MAITKVLDIAYVRLAAPDLDQQEEFLTQFGLVRAARTPVALYMRGSDPPHHLHVTELGKPRFIGFAYEAAAESELEKLTRLPGASAIEAIDEPGGGKRVRLRDPHGFQIEVVFGIEKLAPLPLPENTVNTAHERERRLGTLTRLGAGPVPVKRLGHGVIVSTDLVKALAWYRETLGFIPSDEIFRDDERNVISSFNRIDRGETFVDHHVFFCMQGPKAGLNHIAFEVANFDAVMLGHEHMKSLGKYRPIWGPGRHIYGSQIFDYWADPWGRVHEHMTDSDRLNAAAEPHLNRAAPGGNRSQWGDSMPAHFINYATP